MFAQSSEKNQDVAWLQDHATRPSVTTAGNYGTSGDFRSLTKKLRPLSKRQKQWRAQIKLSDPNSVGAAIVVAPQTTVQPFPSSARSGIRGGGFRTDARSYGATAPTELPQGSEPAQLLPQIGRGCLISINPHSSEGELNDSHETHSTDQTVSPGSRRRRMACYQTRERSALSPATARGSLRYSEP
jgi:hypothetical protein